MLIPLRQLYQRHQMKISGIIHVGAHWAQEHKEYMLIGVDRIAYIEASKPTYDKLCRMHLQGSVTLHHTALADYEGQAEMHVETANQGQSSSLLKPGTHLSHYPSITFPATETVNVTTLDRLALTGYNMLNLDVQGAELLVLKGGRKTLEGIDYIYTEVNREAVYEGCALVEQLDEFLDGFKRVETAWTDQGWGDALYIRTGGPVIYPVPVQFRPPHPFPYPSTNKMEFERWFYENVVPSEIRGRTYLPIFWTGYYCKFKYGTDKTAIGLLQKFIDKLPALKYFTIVQYDDGILNDVSKLDLKIFSMGGGRVDYPLPLIAEPLPSLPPVTKDIFCSFVGKITHECRKPLLDLTNLPGYYISTKTHTPAQYAAILNRSRLVLCPRGYGLTSFRIQEALQFGAVPVYISDKFVFPHNEHHFGIVPIEVQHFSIDYLNKLLSGLTVKPELQKELYNNYYTYSANKKLILENI